MEIYTSKYKCNAAWKKNNNKLVSFNAKPKHPVTKQHLFQVVKIIHKQKLNTFSLFSPSEPFLNCKVFVSNSSIANSLWPHIKLDIISFLNNTPCGDRVNWFWLPWSAWLYLSLNFGEGSWSIIIKCRMFFKLVKWSFKWLCCVFWRWKRFPKTL